MFGRDDEGKLVLVGRRKGEIVAGFRDDEGRDFVFRKPPGSCGFYMQVQPEFPFDPDPLKHADGNATLAERIAKELWWCRKLKFDKGKPPHRRIGEIGIVDGNNGTQFLMRNRRRCDIYKADSVFKTPFMPVGRGSAVVVGADGRRWLIGGIFSGLRKIPLENMASCLTLICSWMPIEGDVEPGVEVDRDRCLVTP